MKKTNRCIHIGNIVGGEYYCEFETSNRIYSINGISPTLTAHYDGKFTGFKIAIYEQDKTEISDRNRKEEK